MKRTHTGVELAVGLFKIPQISQNHLSIPLKPGLGTYVILPVTGSTMTVPFAGGLTTDNVDGSTVVPKRKGSSFARVFNTTGSPCRVIPISVLASGKLSSAFRSITLIVKVAVGQFTSRPGGQTDTSNTYKPAVLLINVYAPLAVSTGRSIEGFSGSGTGLP